MFGSDFIVIKDNRGFKTGFHWSDVHAVLENYERNRKWIKVKFRCDPEGSYPLKFVMTLDEFLEQVEKQLNPQDTRKCTPNPYDFPPPPADEFLPNRVSVVPLSNPYKDGPADQIET